MQGQPQKQHQWRQQLLGEWTSEGQVMAPDGHFERRSGKAFVRALGDLWIVADIEEDVPDGAQAMTLGSLILTLGYDPDEGGSLVRGSRRCCLISGCMKASSTSLARCCLWKLRGRA